MKLFKSCEDGRHKFEGRYDKKGAPIDEWEGILTERRLAFVEKLRDVTYVRDVCVRCGKTIERDPSAKRIPFDEVAGKLRIA